MFSFNSPQGACPECKGIGSKLEIDPDLVVPDKSLSINEGAIAPWKNSNKKDNYYNQMLQAVADFYGFSLDTPFEDLDKKYRKIILFGSKEKIPFSFRRRNRSYMVNRPYEGVVIRLQRLYFETKSNWNRKHISKFMSDRKCYVCNGRRLRPEILAVTVGGKNFAEVCEMSIKNSYEFF